LEGVNGSQKSAVRPADEASARMASFHDGGVVHTMDQRQCHPWQVAVPLAVTGKAAKSDPGFFGRSPSPGTFI
jgi:hypothetical protein